MAVKKKKKVSKQTLSPLIIEVISILTLALSFLLILSVYTQSGAGALGQFFRTLLKGLFGFGAYLLPVVMAAVSIYMLMTEKKFVSRIQIILGIILFLVLIGFVYVLNMDTSVEYENAFDFIKRSYSTGNYNNGGLFGATLGIILYAILGKLGAYIVIITATVVSFILLTGYSVASLLRKTKSEIKEVVKNKRPLKIEEKPIAKPIPEKKIKRLNYVINDDKDEVDEEIHIITGGKKFAKAPVKKATVIPFDREIKSEKAFETAVETVNEIFADDIKPEPEEKFVPPKLNFDVVVDDVIEEPEEPEIKKAEPIKINKKEKENIVPFIRLDTAGDTPYEFPPIDFLNENPNTVSVTTKSQILENTKKLEDTLKSFGVEARVIEVSKGPAVTRYELSPGQGVKVSKISTLADDLALNLAAAGIRIEAPIPGKAAVGIEVPNKEVLPVFLREVIETADFVKFPSKLAFALGKDIAGNATVADIAKMPHLLIAGATGSGKSVCINTLITSVIYKSNPDEVKLLMIDPKVVELSVYNGIPHLLIPVVTDAKKAAGALNWAVREMINRYNLFAETSVRDLKGYNAFLTENGGQPLPQIVIIVDELADLMMVAKNEVEDAICRLAQMARAAGLHLVIATQRPSVDVITGLIKANIPSRIAFSVTSGTDSRTILDMTGAEKLLGKGDMLFYPVGFNKPLRVQGSYISDKEVETIVAFLKQNSTHTYSDEMVQAITSVEKGGESSTGSENDELFVEAMDFLAQREKASVSMLQRRFRIGYNRAARLMEELEERGFVESETGAKPRKVLLSALEWDDYKERNQL